MFIACICDISDIQKQIYKKREEKQKHKRNLMERYKWTNQTLEIIRRIYFDDHAKQK